MAQWHKDKQSFLGNGDTLFETVTLADNYGAMSDWRPNFTSKNRLKVSNPQTIFWSTWGRAPDNDTFASQNAGGGTEYISNDAADPKVVCMSFTMTKSALIDDLVSSDDYWTKEKASDWVNGGGFDMSRMPLV